MTSLVPLHMFRCFHFFKQFILGKFSLIVNLVIKGEKEKFGYFAVLETFQFQSQLCSIPHLCSPILNTQRKNVLNFFFFLLKTMLLIITVVELLYSYNFVYVLSANLRS